MIEISPFPGSRAPSLPAALSWLKDAMRSTMENTDFLQTLRGFGPFLPFAPSAEV